MDATEFYDLPAAARLLWADSVRLARLAATRAVPAARMDGAWKLPRAWVDAEAGLLPGDADALRSSWLERLAPPSLAARRTVRNRSRLPAEHLLTAEETGRALLCDRTRLARLDADGTLAALVVDGAPHFDAELVAALAAGPDDAAAVHRSAPRRALVVEWARAEYATSDPRADAPKAPPPRPTRDLSRADGFETVDED